MFTMSTVTVTSGQTVPEDDIPDVVQAMWKKGYRKTEAISDVYAGVDYTHYTEPTFWYLDDSNKLVPFDENVVIVKDTNVYLLTKALSLYLMMSGEILSTTAFYDDETRTMDSLKDILVSGRNQLELALDNNLIPNYDEITERLIDELSARGIIDADKNVKILNVQVPIRQLVSESITNNMIKQYIRDTVKDPAKLDNLLSLMDVSAFASQIDMSALINSMTDAEILDLLQSAQYRDEIKDFIVSDLHDTDSTMIDYVTNYIVTDDAFKSSLIDRLIEDLKVAGNTSTLKTRAINYIKEQLADPTSQLYDKFVNMAVEDIKSAESAVLPSVIEYVKEVLAANTTDGANLRNEILTGSLLSQLLDNNAVKERVINLVITDSFIDNAFESADFREFLLESVSNNELFINQLLTVAEFRDYVVDQLKGTNDLAQQVANLVADSSSNFRRYILDTVKNDSGFRELMQAGNPVRTAVYDAITWDEFVSDDDDLLKHVLNQTGVTGTYDFIDLDDVETSIADYYDANKDITDPSYSELSASDKATIKNNMYADDGAKDYLIDELQTVFNTYKAGILDDLAVGNNITNATAVGIIDDEIADYINDFINGEFINSDLENAIEDILFKFVGKILKNDTADILADDALNTEISAMLTEIDTIKHNFVDDSDASIVTVLKNLFKSYTTSNENVVKDILNTNYNSLTTKLTTLLNNNTTVYGNVEQILIDVVADPTNSVAIGNLITDYINGISNSDLKALVKKYVEGITTVEITNYIAAFLNAKQENVDSIRAELQTFVNDAEQLNTIKDTAKDYLSDPANSDDVRDEVGQFLDSLNEEFVAAHRDVINDALSSIDLSALVDADKIKDYINGLGTDGEKNTFADKIYNALQTNAYYNSTMYDLFHKNELDVTRDNLSILGAISSAIRGLDIDTALSNAGNSAVEKAIDILGKDYVTALYNAMVEDYCDGLDEVIANVKATETADTYTTALPLKLDIIEAYKKVYAYLQPKAVEKLQAADVRYDENIYLNYLVNHDILAGFLSGDGSGKDIDRMLTGYKVKDVLDIYDYLMMLVFVGDDALCYYGTQEGNLTEEQFDAVYNTVFEKIKNVTTKVNDVLRDFENDGTLPSQIQGVVDKVQRINDALDEYSDSINSVIRRYLSNSITVKAENGTLKDESKTIKAVDWLVASDDPIITVDTIYALFYEYDDQTQAKLKSVIDSGKLKKAIDKFESSRFGNMFRVDNELDSLYDVLENIANNGIEQYKVTTADVTVVDKYEVTIGQVTITVERHFE